MDIQEIISNIKEKAVLTFNNITEWIQENTKQALIICGSAFIVLVCIILLIAFRPKPKNKSLEQELILSEELLVPPSPAVPNGYNSSRTTKDKWTNEEIDVWFTKPTEKEIEDLSKANDRIISDVVEAAP